MSLRRMMMSKVQKKKLFLYNEGDECLSVTGGWSNSIGLNQGASVFDKTPAYMEIACDKFETITISTNKEIDSSEYSTFNALIYAKNLNAGLPTNFAFGINKSDLSGKFMAHRAQYPNSDIIRSSVSDYITVSFDISEDTPYFNRKSSVYSIILSSDVALPTSNKIYKIWLE